MKIRQTKILGLALLLGGLALVGVGLWLLLSPAQYAATARIKIEMDESYDSFFTRPNSTMAYDTYYTPTIFEVIQSQLVLGRVVTNLNLNTVWSDKYFKGAQLNTPKTVEIIKSKMSMALVCNTRSLTITFQSDDPKEAAQIANAIAESYYNYRITTRRELSKKGLETLQLIYQDEEKRLSLQPTNQPRTVT